MSLSAPNKITVPFANSGTKNTIPVASQIGITAGAASYTDGFPPLTMTPVASGGVPPFGQDFNGIFFAVTQALQWLQSGGGYAFDSTFATAVGGYPQWAMVQRSDGKGYWLNTVANNTANPESSPTSGWLPLSNNATTAITMTSSNVTLTALQAGAGIIYLSGALTTNLNLVFPTWKQEWLVVNNCTGSFSVTCKTASGTGVAIAAGSNAIIYGDGTNIVTAGGLVEQKILSISAGTVASNALTVGYPAQAISFHSATTTSGASSVISAAAGSLTIPSGATLGTVNGRQATIMLLALNNGGTVEPAVVNLAGGVDLSETGLISTTAISASATAANVVYSDNARTNVPYRVIGAYSVTEATAGVWETEPSQAIGAGGQAFSALMSYGYGQTPQVLTGSRTAGTTYYNTTNRPKLVSALFNNSTYAFPTGNVNGVACAYGSAYGASGVVGVTFIVPPGASYSASTSAGSPVYAWSELG